MKVSFQDNASSTHKKEKTNKNHDKHDQGNAQFSYKDNPVAQTGHQTI